MTTTLTSRERVDRMFARQDHDRVPRHDSYWNETIARWTEEGLTGGAGGALALLGSDFHGVAGSWKVPFPGRNETVREDERTRVYRDGWGATVRYWKGRSGTPEHLGFGCSSRDLWEREYRPALLDQAGRIDADGIHQASAAGRAAGKWCFVTGLETFEVTRRLMGDEIALFAMAAEPEWVADVSRVCTDVMLADYDAMVAAGLDCDGLWMYGDMAFNHATMCSPAMYRELIWPDHKRLADWAHAHGLKFIYHTDGDVNGVLDLYVEAGFDCFQPIEAKANLDVRTLIPRYGDKLAFFGNIDVMVLGRNDPDEVEHEVVTKLAAGKAGKCYAYHSDHSVPPLCSFATYRLVIELLERHGRYE